MINPLEHCERQVEMNSAVGKAQMMLEVNRITNEAQIRINDNTLTAYGLLFQAALELPESFAVMVNFIEALRQLNETRGAEPRPPEKPLIGTGPGSYRRVIDLTNPEDARRFNYGRT